MPSLSDLPVDLLLDNLLPVLPIPSLLALSQTSKFFATLAADDTYWKRRLQDDFNFDTKGSARQSGWRVIYRGLRRPRVYTWGENSKGRLGLGNSSLNSDNPRSKGMVLHPMRVHFPENDVRIVGLAAGGMSFHAIDSGGQVWVWGTLDGLSIALNSDGFSEPAKTAFTPHRLHLPVSVRTISCGRLHTLFLTPAGIYTLTSWGRPFILRARNLAVDSALSSFPVQAEAGWAFCAALTRAGRVAVWWPFSGPLERKIVEKNQEMDRENKKARPEGYVIPCATFELEHEPLLLPELPELPKLRHAGADSAGEAKLMKIAGLDNAVVGLTDQGHVIVCNDLAGEDQAKRARWEYLPSFSEVNEVRNLPIFQAGANLRLDPPESMHITHISGHFRTLTAYSSTTVLTHSDPPLHPSSAPTILPALQNKSVISVVLGDYHSGALTATGSLLTWGAFSKGALGLGDPRVLDLGAPGGYTNQEDRNDAHAYWPRITTPPRVEDPAVVRFDWTKRGERKVQQKEVFVVGAAAAGWHTGALVIPLKEDDYAEDSDVEEDYYKPDPVDSDERQHPIPPLPGGFPSQPPHGIGLPTMTPFRVGFAGRGRGRAQMWSGPLRGGPARGRGDGPPGGS